MSKYEELEERTYKFAKDVRSFVKILPKQVQYYDDARQLLRSSGSVAANYIEANESPAGSKEFLYRIRIAKKEAKESRLWLRLIDFDDAELAAEQDRLIQESIELMKIMAAIIRNSTTSI
tara:strand:+ start:37 stop:396 length:360 start_codon:yes stop_codon:yes gene_type:complete